LLAQFFISASVGVHFHGCLGLKKIKVSVDSRAFESVLNPVTAIKPEKRQKLGFQPIPNFWRFSGLTMGWKSETITKPETREKFGRKLHRPEKYQTFLEIGALLSAHVRLKFFFGILLSM
jgi:hypothetical protein